MRHHPSVRATFLGAIASAGFCILSALSPARAEVTAAQAAGYADLVRDFNALIILRKPDLPRWSSQSDREVLEKLWSPEPYLGKPPYRASDLPHLFSIMDKQNTVMQGYLGFVPPGASAPDADQAFVIYQDESVRAAATFFATVGALLPALTAFVESLPPSDMTQTRKAGLARMRLGLVQMSTGFSMAIRSPGLHEDNRRILLQALASNAKELAAALPVQGRANLKATLMPVGTGLAGEDRILFDRALSPLGRTDCTALCSIANP